MSILWSTRNYNKTNNKKYRSVVFLSQRFKESSIQQNAERGEKKVDGQNLGSKISTDLEAKNKELENLQFFRQMSIAQKIKLLREPAYATNTKAINKLHNQFKFIGGTQVRGDLKNTDKIISQHCLESQIISDRSVHQPNHTNRSKMGKNSTKREETASQKQKGKVDQSIQAKTKAKTDRSLFELQLETEMVPNIYIKNLKGQRCQTQLNEAKKLNNESVRWMSKSSLEWMEQDNLRGDDGQGGKWSNNKKIRRRKGKQLSIPKSCLYMSMYLRMRDKQENLETSNQHVENASSKKLMKIAKIPHPTSSQYRPSQYFLKAKQSNALFKQGSYYTLTSKLKGKKSNKQQPLQESGDLILYPSMQACGSSKECSKSRSKKRYRKQSHKNSFGHGPTITIDPW